MAYDPTEWHDLFVAAAGASAALAGLLFVAVSINLERILQFQGLPERALETVAMLLGVLLISLVGLIPGQSHVSLGAEVLVIGVVLCAFIGRLPTQYTGHDAVPRSWVYTRWTLRLIGTVPFLVAGLSLLAEAGGGLYWVVDGIVFAILAAVANAWVLLVEILR
jgi:modulator of FtsH protease